MTAAPEAPRSARTHLRSFHELMQHRVVRIMLVSSLYDSFIMSEEGHLQETLLGHFIDLNLSQIPDLVQVSSCTGVLERLACRRVCARSRELRRARVRRRYG